MTSWPKPRRLLVEMEDGALFQLVHAPEVIAASADCARPYQVAMPGRVVGGPLPGVAYLMMEVDHRESVGIVVPS